MNHPKSVCYNQISLSHISYELLLLYLKIFFFHLVYLKQNEREKRVFLTNIQHNESQKLLLHRIFPFEIIFFRFYCCLECFSFHTWFHRNDGGRLRLCVLIKASFVSMILILGILFINESSIKAKQNIN